MRIFLTGANGFIGSQIAATLAKAGHEIIAAVRTSPRFPERFSQVVYCDFNHDHDPAVWLSRLQNIDVVINTVGIFQERHGESIQSVHTDTPMALFKACEEAGVKRVVHISALGADPDAATPYAVTKRAAEQALAQTSLDWVILRPSLVYASGSYGGSSLLRGLAGLPGVLSLLSDVNPAFQPIHLEDLAEAIKNLVEKSGRICQSFDAVGSEKISYNELFPVLRRWLGFGKALTIKLPSAGLKLLGKLGDWINLGPLNSTAIKMLLHGNVTTKMRAEEFFEAAGFVPRGFRECLTWLPSYVQDRWHARLYFMRPLLQFVLSLVWILSGIVALLNWPASEKLVSSTGLILGGAGAYILLGFLLLINVKPRIVIAAQMIFLLAYTVLASFLMPQLWLDPLGSLIKNLVVLIAFIILFILTEVR